MRFFSLFWALFILYFIFIHPAIIYYSSDLAPDPATQNPYLSLIYLSLAITLWTTTFILFTRLLYKSTYGLQKDTERLGQEGTLIQANIDRVKSETQLSNGFIQKETVVSFYNLSHTQIHYPLILTDSKPHQQRYNHGQQVALRVDPHLKYRPYIIPDGVQTSIDSKTMLLYTSVWILSIFAVAGYFYYAYNSQNQGYGWRFLSWTHPLILSPVILYAFLAAFYLFFAKLLSPHLSKGSGDKKVIQLLLWGRRATANITDVKQTGTYINEQPQIKFNMNFVDHNSMSHQVSIKKIVSLLDLTAIQLIQSKPILYLPDAPQTIAFEEDLYQQAEQR